MILLWIHAAAAGGCESVKLEGKANPMTGEPYREEECRRILELAADCPTNPLVPGTEGFARRTSVREHQRAASTADGAVQEMVDDALKDLRARFLLADYVPTLLKRHPTKYDSDFQLAYSEMKKQCTTSYDALKKRFRTATYEVTAAELCKPEGNTLGIAACQAPVSLTDHPR